LILHHPYNALNVGQKCFQNVSQLGSWEGTSYQFMWVKGNHCDQAQRFDHDTIIYNCGVVTFFTTKSKPSSALLPFKLKDNGDEA
jgi:hypothetical protein